MNPMAQALTWCLLLWIVVGLAAIFIDAVL